MNGTLGAPGSKGLRLALVVGLAGMASLAGWLVVKSLRREGVPVPTPSMPTESQSTTGGDGSSTTVLDSSEVVEVPEREEGSERSQASDTAKQKINELRAKMEGYAAIDGWSDTYAQFSAADLIREASVLQDALRKSTTDEIMRRFEAGQYEVVSTGPTISLKSSSFLEVFSIRPGKAGQWLKVLLPEAEFPTEYKLQAQIQWLHETARDRQFAGR